MNNELRAFLATTTTEVDRWLKQCLAELPADRLREAMDYSLFNGGKRIRPALCYASATVFAPISELTHRACAALELVHAYSLVHDDLPAMDDDDLRRGKPTCHIAFDEATAILAGDALQTLAFTILSAPCGNDCWRQLQVINTLSDAAGASGMVLGQSQDLAAEDRLLSFGELETMHRHKTGALINASIKMGALSVQGASDSDLHVLDQYGKAIGLAFQIKDDILDVESSTEVLGKPQGADSLLNKATYTSILGMEGARARLSESYQAACDAASHFGSKARMLRLIADFIVERNH